MLSLTVDMVCPASQAIAMANRAPLVLVAPAVVTEEPDDVPALSRVTVIAMGYTWHTRVAMIAPSLIAGCAAHV